MQKEQVLQINLINWFSHEFPELEDDLHHFANERKCSFRQGRILKRMGVKKGVSDLFLAIGASGFHGLWIELKEDGGRLSNEQIEFIKRKIEKNYFAVAVWGIEAAKKIIIDYLREYIEKGNTMKEDKESEITLDNWKPSKQEPKLVASNWRKEQIGTNFNQFVGIDELKKIKSALKKKYHDHTIMETYGVNAETLTAIKQNRYSPTGGIECDNAAKVFNELKRLEGKLFGVKCMVEELAKILFTTKKEQSHFIGLLNVRDKRKINFIDNDEEE